MDDRGKILVVEDHPTTRLKLSLGLQQQGHTVAEAENGVQALEKLRSDSFDLVLLDIVMPEMDGYQVMEEMKRDKKLLDIPVIVISASDELESIVRGIELGADDYLPKSCAPILLKARIGGASTPGGAGIVAADMGDTVHAILPDGNRLELPAGATGLDAAAAIGPGLEKAAVAIVRTARSRTSLYPFPTAPPSRS